MHFHLRHSRPLIFLWVLGFFTIGVQSVFSLDFKSFPTFSANDLALLGVEKEKERESISAEALCRLFLGTEQCSLTQQYGLRDAAWEIWKAERIRFQVYYLCMQDSKAAFSAYTFLKSPEADSLLEPGIPAQTKNGIFIWQSNFLIRITAKGESRGNVALQTMTMASFLARAVSEKSKAALPLVMRLLPKEGRVPGSGYYFLGKTGLGKLLPWIDEDWIGFQDSAETAVSDYNINNSSCRLFLIEYPNTNLARQYFDSIPAVLSKTDRQGQSFHIKRTRLLVALLFGNLSSSIADRFLTGIEYNYSIKWIYDRKKPVLVPTESVSLVGVFLQSFLFIGLVGLCAMVAGFCIGAGRYVVRDFLEDDSITQPKKWRMVRLKLVE